MKSAGNAVISTLLMHRSHGLQHLRHKRPTFAFVGESGYTRHPSPEPRTQRLTRRNRWRFGWGWYHYPRSVPHVSETLRGQGVERQTLPLLGLGRVLPKNAESLRDSDALMRVAVPRRRGPAGLRDLFAFVEIAACTPCTHGLSACARRGVVSLPSVHFACSRNAGRPLVKTANLPFSEVGWA